MSRSSIVTHFVIIVLAVAVAPRAFGDQVALPLDVMDGLENPWAVQKDGSILGVAPYKSGGNRAGKLLVDGAGFPEIESATRTVREGGIEVTLGPRVVGPVHVTRKVYFGKGEGHVRFIDALENRSTTPVTVKVTLFSDVNNCKVVWENDNTVVAAGDGGVATEVVYGTGGAQKPLRNARSSDLEYTWDAISIQPESKVVFLHFSAVRPQREQALEFAQAFDVAPACAEIDGTDLSNIANFDPRTLGAKAGIEIFRGGEKDVFLLKSGDKLTGTVQNEMFRIQTSYAQLEFPAEQIATVIYEGGANNIERLVVLNGDVFSGFILDPDVTVKLEAGPVMKIRKEKISRLGFRIRANEKEKYPVTHDVTLTNGDHFSGTVKNASLKIGAAFGEMPVEIHQIAKIEFISKKGVVTEITLKNGDTVSGFLKDEDIVIGLDFGREVSIYQDRIEKIIFDRQVLERISGEAFKKHEEGGQSQR